jgi:hypothetical protein
MGAPQAANAEPLVAAGARPADQQIAGWRRPWWAWAGLFALVLTVLVVRSRFLFTARIYEQGDAAIISFAAAPATAVNTGDTDAALPGAVSAVAASAHGKTIVIYLDHAAWPDVTGFLVQAERAGVRACVASPGWTFMMTRQFICTPGQVLTGAPFWFRAPAATPGMPVIATLKNSAITAGAA